MDLTENERDSSKKSKGNGMFPESSSNENIKDGFTSNTHEQSSNISFYGEHIHIINLTSKDNSEKQTTSAYQLKRRVERDGGSHDRITRLSSKKRNIQDERIKIEKPETNEIYINNNYYSKEEAGRVVVSPGNVGLSPPNRMSGNSAMLGVFPVSGRSARAGGGTWTKQAAVEEHSAKVTPEPPPNNTVVNAQVGGTATLSCFTSHLSDEMVSSLFHYFIKI